jgi:hypothetical protein
METAAGTAGTAGTHLRAAQDRGATAVAAIAEVQAYAGGLTSDPFSLVHVLRRSEHLSM